MKNVRVFFKKDFECRYISHLDLVRIITRAIQRSELNIWHTQGYNSRIYLTFSLPLSLGIRSDCENFDIRLTDDAFDISDIPDMLNPFLPHGVKILSVSLPKYPYSQIDSALYQFKISSDDISNLELYSLLSRFIKKPEILVEKKTKRGMRTIDIAPSITEIKIEDFNDNDEDVVFSANLPAGSAENINPFLLINAISDFCNAEIYADITRKNIMMQGGAKFE